MYFGWWTPPGPPGVPEAFKSPREGPKPGWFPEQPQGTARPEPAASAAFMWSGGFHLEYQWLQGHELNKRACDRTTAWMSHKTRWHIGLWWFSMKGLSSQFHENAHDWKPSVKPSAHLPQQSLLEGLYLPQVLVFLSTCLHLFYTQVSLSGRSFQQWKGHKVGCCRNSSRFMCFNPNFWVSRFSPSSVLPTVSNTYYIFRTGTVSPQVSTALSITS